MTTYTELFSPSKNVSQKWFRNTTALTATTVVFTIPVGVSCLIISALGAGGWKTNSNLGGGGAAFARKKLTDLVAGETFTLQIGNPKFSLDVGTSQGDSIITRDSTMAVVCKAVRGTGVTSSNVQIPGLAVDCIGDTKRDGVAGPGNSTGGASGSDAGDIYSLGLGGRGARAGRYAAAGYGGGGIHLQFYDELNQQKRYFPGGGVIVMDLWSKTIPVELGV